MFNFALERRHKVLQTTMKKRQQENADRTLKNPTKSPKDLTGGRYRSTIWTVIITVCLWQVIKLGLYTSEEFAAEYGMDPEYFFNVVSQSPTNYLVGGFKGFSLPILAQGFGFTNLKSLLRFRGFVDLVGPCLHTMSEIIKYHGYPNEEYQIETEDGYILTVFRILHGKYNGADKDSRPTVFLLHSFLGEASMWILNQPNNSLGFFLADAGYDVWIGNSRGNTYSSNHKTLKPTEQKFWDFSLHEMGYYDVPAVIDFILNKTGQQQLYYIGHSEGSAVGFIAFSTWPKLTEKIKVFFALGPTISLTFAQTPVLKLGGIYETIFNLGFLNKGMYHYPTYIRKPCAMFCTYLPKYCAYFVSAISGFNIPNLNMSRLGMYATHLPAGTSGKNIIHWIQIHRAKLFQAYDYGSAEKNMEKYNQTKPPIYRIEDIKTPIAIWLGGQDYFVDPRDATTLSSRISNLIYEKHIPEWQHIDFIWGLDASERMYMDIIEIMKKYL